MKNRHSIILKKFYGSLRIALSDINHAKDELIFTEENLLEYCLPAYKKFLPKVKVEGEDEIKFLIEKIENEYPQLVEEYFDALNNDEDDEPYEPYNQQPLIDSKSKKLIIKEFDKPLKINNIKPGNKKDKWNV